VKEGTIIRISAAELNSLPRRRDWFKFDALTDRDIAEAVAADPDAPPLNIDWSKAKMYHPRTKALLSIRIDADILGFFKASGPRYQTRMNAALRAYMDHELAKHEEK
jgi:uncharacterized protein (DUF4415 family)